jgi:hypothetical protein
MNVVNTLAIKLALLGLGATATGTGMLIAEAHAAFDGGEGTAWVVSSGALTVGSLGILLQLVRMWMRGDIVSKVTNNHEERMIKALEDNAEALTASLDFAAKMSEDSIRREEVMERIIAAYLPHRPSEDIDLRSR